MKENKFVAFVKEHKKQIIWITVGVAGIVVGANLLRRGTNSNYKLLDNPFTKDDTGMVCEAVKGRYKGCITGAVKNVSIDDLGVFGEKLLTVEGINATDKLGVIVAVEGKWCE